MSALGCGPRLCPLVSVELFRSVAPGRTSWHPWWLSASLSLLDCRVSRRPSRPTRRVSLQEAGDAGPAVAVGHGAAGERAHRLPLPTHHPQHEGTAPAGPRSGGGLACRAGTGAEHRPPSTWGPSACAPALRPGWAMLESGWEHKGVQPRQQGDGGTRGQITCSSGSLTFVWGQCALRHPEFMDKRLAWAAVASVVHLKASSV